MSETRACPPLRSEHTPRILIGVIAFLAFLSPALAQEASNANGATAPRVTPMAPPASLVTIVNVLGKLGTGDLLSPDPSQLVVVRDEALEANPGRPGVPLSIPGLPAETASGGIKAPQYFAPGVAGDHGEPIAREGRVHQRADNRIIIDNENRRRRGQISVIH